MRNEPSRRTLERFNSLLDINGKRFADLHHVASFYDIPLNVLKQRFADGYAREALVCGYKKIVKQEIQQPVVISSVKPALKKKKQLKVRKLKKISPIVSILNRKTNWQNTMNEDYNRNILIKNTLLKMAERLI